MQEMTIVMDVEEIHTPKYEPTTTHIEEEKNPAQGPGSQRRMQKGHNLMCPGEKGCSRKNMPWI
jgi:hypothetical protein